MNKEQIIDEVYKNFEKDCIPGTGKKMTKEEFINFIKTQPEFSERWGLKIEEREILKQIDQTNPMLKGSTTLVPTKLITLTYNNETIESYE